MKAYFVSLLLLCGCAATPAPRTERRPSLASFPSETPRSYYLAWDYITNSGPVGFEVYHATSLAGFTWLGGTNIPAGFMLFTNALASPVPIAADLASEFFIVRATNSIGPSDWAH